MNKKITALLALFLILDTVYSFYIHFYLPHDGDMSPIIVPGFWYADVLSDPFGFSILTEGKVYAGSNRFFAHWSLGAYFKTVPFLLQKLTNPLDSTYLASAIIRTALHLFIIWLLATFITGSGKWWKPKFILAAALVAPLMQMEGLFNKLVIIGNSITYTFFYALSVAMVVLFFLPFYRAYVLKQGFNLTLFQRILLAALTVIIPFQGPLNLGVNSVVASTTLFYFWWQGLKQNGGKSGNFFTRAFQAILNIPRPVLFYFSALLILSLYSYYIGLFNAENITVTTVALKDRYPLLLWGLNSQLFFGEGMMYGPAHTILFLVILINVLLLWKRGGAEGRRIVQILKWAGLLSILYLLLLPLGGYRTYRPFIVESNTFMPVNLVIYYAFGLTCWFVLLQLKFNLKKFYVGFVTAVLLVFALAERPNKVSYACEREGILKLAASKEDFINLDTWCGVMSWGPVTNPWLTETYGKMLHYWGILDKPKTYVTKKEN